MAMIGNYCPLSGYLVAIVNCYSLLLVTVGGHFSWLFGIYVAVGFFSVHELKLFDVRDLRPLRAVDTYQ